MMPSPFPHARIRELVESADPGVRSAAASVLDALQADGDVPWLEGLLDAREPVVHNFAARALVRSGQPSAQIEHVFDAHPERRRALLDALRHHPRSALFGRLAALLTHEDHHTAHLAAHALVGRELPDDVDAILIDALAGQLGSSVGELGREAHELLESHLAARPERALGLVRHPSGAVRALALEVLAHQPSEASRACFVEALQDPHTPVRLVAARVCGEQRIEEAREGLQGCLDEAEPESFAAALRALTRLGPQAGVEVTAEVVEALAAFAVSPELAVAEASLEALASVDAERAVEVAMERCAPPEARAEPMIDLLRGLATPSARAALVALLEHPAPVVRGQAALAIGELGIQDATGALIALLDMAHGNKDSAAHALGDLVAEGAIGPLIAAFEGVTDADAIFGRDPVIEALARMPEAVVVPKLVEALDHPSWWVYTGAAEALGTIASPAAIEALLGALDHREPQVREYAARILGVVGNPDVVERLVAALDDPWPGTRVSALESLAQLGPAARPALEVLAVKLAGDDPDERVFAAEALGAIGDLAALEPLRAALGDPDAEVRTASVLALAQLRDEAAVEALLPLLADPEVGVRDAAAVGLGQLASASAIPALLAALGEPTSQIQRAAAEALIAIGTWTP